MKWLGNIGGVLLVLIGLAWFFQGINVFQGSVMSWQPQWTLIGAVAFILGGAVPFFTNRRRASVGK